MRLLSDIINRNKKQINLSDIVGNHFFTQAMWYFGERKLFAIERPKCKYLLYHFISVLREASQ
jgi:hypothetical protein